MTSPAILTRLTTALADRYTIEREIGEGGMATVFLATDVRHERRVAIKVLHPELSAMLGPDRFLSEIKLTASLQHPHILPLFDSGAADGLLYYVMPFVEGETLRRRLDRERQLPVNDAIKLATEIADALQYAHDRGIVHRDIKPENVLLQGGRAMVADFGIALAVQQAGGTRMTQTGMSLGTPQYMAPEQAMGERNIDARADIYALGAMTYEMLAGEPPFTGPTAQAIVAKVMTERAKPLRAVRDTVPEFVEIGVSTALEKLPADRFASAAQFAASLDQANAAVVVRRSGAQTTARAASAASRGVTALLAVVTLVAGIAIGAFALNRGRGTDASASDLALQFAVTPPDSVRLRLICCGQMFAISPNGRWLVFQGDTTNPTRPMSAPGDTLATDARVNRLYARDLTTLVTTPLKGTESATSMFFSPASDEIAFVSKQQLWRMPVAGGEPQSIASVPEGYVGGGSWTDDGQMVLAVSGKMLHVSDRGGKLELLFPADTTGLQFGGPQAWTKEHVMLYTIGGFGVVPRIVWRSMESGKTRIVASGATPTYVPSAHALLLVRYDGSLVQYPFNLATGDTTGPAVRIASRVARRSPIVIHAEYSASPNGTVVVVARRDSKSSGGISMVDLANAPSTKVMLTEFQLFAMPLLSPDNSKLLIGIATPPADYTPYVVDVARNAYTRLQVDSSWGAFTWSSGGDSIIYSSRQNEVVEQPINGSAYRTVIYKLRDWTLNTGRLSVWGKWLALDAAKTGVDSRRIVVANRDSAGKERPLYESQYSQSNPAISPDGKWVAFSSTENGHDDVFVSEFPVSKGRYLVSTNGGVYPTWSADSRAIFFYEVNQVLAATFSPGSPPTIGAPKVIYRREPWASADISSTGKLLVFADRVREGDPAALVVQLHAVTENPSAGAKK